MGKRSDFERNERDYYPTPYKCILPLLPHLKQGASFLEPCAGNGVLIDHLYKHGFNCKEAIDIEPRKAGILKGDILDFSFENIDCDYIITNPPWDRKILHPMIEKFVSTKIPTWLLFDADWMHNISSKELIKKCACIVSVGRVKWIENSKYSGKDNCCWYLFDKNKGTIFYGR